MIPLVFALAAEIGLLAIFWFADVLRSTKIIVTLIGALLTLAMIFGPGVLSLLGLSGLAIYDICLIAFLKFRGWPI